VSAPPTVEARILELVRLGLKVHDIAALLGAHPKAVARAIPPPTLSAEKERTSTFFLPRRGEWTLRRGQIYFGDSTAKGSDFSRR
jgi:hypothetical protein